MTEVELSKLSEEDLMGEAKKMKSNSIINAVLIGFVMGVIIYSAAKNSFGFFTLIPLFIIYKLVNGSRNYDALKKELVERGLK